MVLLLSNFVDGFDYMLRNWKRCDLDASDDLVGGNVINFMALGDGSNVKSVNSTTLLRISRIGLIIVSLDVLSEMVLAVALVV